MVLWRLLYPRIRLRNGEGKIEASCEVGNGDGNGNGNGNGDGESSCEDDEGDAAVVAEKGKLFGALKVEGDEFM